MSRLTFYLILPAGPSIILSTSIVPLTRKDACPIVSFTVSALANFSDAVARRARTLEQKTWQE